MNKQYKKALVLLNMGGARNKEELEMFLRNMFNDKNILTIKSDFFAFNDCFIDCCIKKELSMAEL